MMARKISTYLSISKSCGFLRIREFLSYSPRLIALRIFVIYILVGIFWIFFSDHILGMLVSSQAQFTQYSIYKGGAFIAFTGVMLYYLIFDSAKKQLEVKATLDASEDRWKFALEGAGDGVWDWDITTDKVFRSARWKEIYGYTNNEIEDTAKAGRMLIHPDDLTHQVKDTQDYLQGKTDLYVSEFRLLCKDRTWKWTLSRGMVISRDVDGKPLRMIGTHTDISDRKNLENQLLQQAHFDQVTGLPNRLLFLDNFQNLITNAKRQHQSVTLMYLDLDHFKEVNDTFGHDMGDILLKHVAERLIQSVRADDIVARLGGDEFTVILNNVNHQITERIAQNILDKLSQPFSLGKEVVYVSASIGISVFPGNATEVGVLLKNADQAMYVAKQNGRNRYCYFKGETHQDHMQ
jgi:diguanylate cyclase (GGDEF)-like protein/PAS domain S-box-containing protein